MMSSGLVRPFDLLLTFKAPDGAPPLHWLSDSQALSLTTQLSVGRGARNPPKGISQAPTPSPAPFQCLHPHQSP